MAPLRFTKWPPQEVVHEQLGSRATCYEAGRDGNAVVITDPDDSTIQQLVMEGAEAQRVVDGVGPVERPPTDVSGVEAYCLGAKAAVVAAHCTPVLVGHEDGITKLRVTSALRCGMLRDRLHLGNIQAEPDYRADLGVQRLGEVGVEQEPRGRGQETRICT